MRYSVRINQWLAAGILLLCTAVASEPASAQQERGTAAEAGVPDIQLRGPEPQGSERRRPAMRKPDRVNPDTHGCPDQGRP